MCSKEQIPEPLSLVLITSDVTSFRGSDGFITLEERGSSGFGYDPLFKAADNPKTFSEDPGHKDEVSHRRKAIELLCRYLKTL